MLGKHNNVTKFWFAPDFREFEAYKATAGFNEGSNSHSYISEEVHILKDNITSHCKPRNSWKYKFLHAHPQG